MSTSRSPECFVISPIGSPESDVRRYADKVLRFLVRHSLEPLGFRVVRADEISEPGTITIQVIRKLMEADLVLADLTGTNPNVMYELAIRHALKKPALLIVSSGESLPFDIMNERTVFFDINDIASIEDARKKIAHQATSVRTEGFRVESPFSLTEGIVLRSSTAAPLDSAIAEIAGDIAHIKGALGGVLENVRFHEMQARQTAFRSSDLPPRRQRWIKIQLEFPAKALPRSSSIEISSDENVFQTLSAIWSLLRKEQQIGAFSPDAYTYLWDWVLVRGEDRMPLVVRGIMSLVRSQMIFRDGERWCVVRLDEPLLHKPERFEFRRKNPDRW